MTFPTACALVPPGALATTSARDRSYRASWCRQSGASLRDLSLSSHLLLPASQDEYAWPEPRSPGALFSGIRLLKSFMQPTLGRVQPSSVVWRELVCVCINESHSCNCARYSRAPAAFQTAEVTHTRADNNQGFFGAVRGSSAKEEMLFLLPFTSCTLLKRVNPTLS